MSAIYRTDAELREERERLMEKLLRPPTWEEIEADAKAWALTHEQRALYDTIKSIDWLLDGDPA